MTNRHTRRLLKLAAWFMIAWCATGCKQNGGNNTCQLKESEQRDSTDSCLVIWLQLKNGIAQIALSPSDSALIEKEFESVKTQYAQTTNSPATPSNVERNRPKSEKNTRPDQNLDHTIGMIMKYTPHPSSQAQYISENFRFWITDEYKPSDFLNSLSFPSEFELTFSEIIQSKFRYLNN